MKIKKSDLLINPDRSIYHLGLKPSQIVDNIIVVGDPQRVKLVSSFFDSVTTEAHNREYHSVIGTYNSKPIMVISSGIGCGAIDILVNELDALVNVDFETMEVKSSHRALNIVRIGTSGAISDRINLGDVVLSKYTIGIDALAHFYPQTQNICENELSELFHKNIFESSPYVIPYSVKSSDELVAKFSDISKQGITMCAGGFFAPQGRIVRLSPRFDKMIDLLAGFSYNGYDFTNIEMEGAALESLAITLGHKAVTICLAIAHRTKIDVNINYHERMQQFVKNVLDRI